MSEEQELENGGAAHAASDFETSLCENEITVTKIEEDSAAFIANAARDFENRQMSDSILSDDGLRPGSREFCDVLDEIKKLHLRKTLDYGVDQDALENVRTGAEAVNVAAWKGCLIRIADKMTRLKNFCRRGKCEFDGVSDSLLDIASYATIALVLYREANAARRVETDSFEID